MLKRLAMIAMLVLLAVVPVHAQPLVAVAVTPSGDGVLTVPVGGAGAFAVAVVNVGSEKVPPVPTPTPLLATVDLPLQQTNGGPWTSVLPLTAWGVCETDPTTGTCLNLPSPGLSSVVFEPGEVKTFSVFVQTSGQIPTDGTTMMNRIGFQIIGVPVSVSIRPTNTFITAAPIPFVAISVQIRNP